MWELKSEKMDYENDKHADAPCIPHIFKESIKIVQAARKQLIGY
jgi:hypothetical protein